MFVDILSDTHFDSWFGYPYKGESDPKSFPPKEKVVAFWQRLRPKGEYLIIAGDIGHSLTQNLHILKILKEVFYQEIILTLGNHDYYVADIIDQHYHDGREKAKDSIKRYREAGMIVLDGTVVELEGVRFGGAMGWYHSAYAKAHPAIVRLSEANHYNDIEAYLQAKWPTLIQDAAYSRLTRFDELFEEEYAKLEAVHQHCDVMVSHYNPSIQMKFQRTQFAKDIATSYFCFDGERLAIQTTAKVWIYGHTHDHKTYIWHNRKFITNTLGYRSDLQYYPNVKILTRECVAKKG